MEKTKEFLECLFSTAHGKAVQFRVVPPGRGYVTRTDQLVLPELDEKSNWYFGVCPREDDTDAIQTACAIWADIDGVAQFPTDKAEVAPPSAIVFTGHGVHVYYFLEEAQPAVDARRLVRLAQLCLDGDKQATDMTRLLRVPGTKNVKREPVTDCKLVHFDDARHTPEQIEEMLLAALLVSEWVEGARNQLTLGFAALCARAGWTIARCWKVIKSVTRAANDNDQTRKSAIELTYTKFEKGEPVASKGFVEVLGQRYKELAKLFGCDTQDGEVKLHGEVVGTAATIQQDLVTLLTKDRCKWAWCEGQLMRWNGKLWVPEEQRSLTAEVFAVMDELTISKGGVEKRRPAKPGEAQGVANIMLGNFALEPMEPPEPELVGMANGTYNLATGEFREHRMEDRLKRLMPLKYDPEAKCERWQQFLEESAPEAKNFLQEWTGYCLKRGNPHQRMLWVYGPAKTGKSTYLGTVFGMFGPMAASLSSQNISQYQIASLTDAYLAVCTELSTAKFRTSVFKSIVSGDPVLARHPYGRPFTVEYSGKIMWGSNSLLNLDEVEGMWRRLVVIPFENVPDKEDTSLAKYLKANELPGIFNWALEGLARLEQYAMDGLGWPIPDCAVELVSRYKDHADPLDMFIEQDMEVGWNFSCSVREVYMRFTEYVKAMGHDQREFGIWFIEEMRRRGFGLKDKATFKGCRMAGQMSNLKWGIQS